MNTEQEKAATGAPQDTVTDVVEESTQGEVFEAAAGASDTVKYETLKRRTRERDNYKSAAKEWEQKAKVLEQDKFEAEGNKDEVISSLKKQVAELSGEKKELFGNFAYSSLENQIQAEAHKLGCVDTEALVQLMNMKGLVESIDTETWKAGDEDIKMAIEEQKQKRSYLFNKQGPKINTSNPNAEFVQKKKSIADMSPEEQKALALSIDASEGKGIGTTFL